MSKDSTINSGASFRITRALSTTTGFGTEVDETIKVHLEELNRLLGKRVFPSNVRRRRDRDREDDFDLYGVEPGAHEPGEAAVEGGEEEMRAAHRQPRDRDDDDDQDLEMLSRFLEHILEMPLSPRHILDDAHREPWEEGSLLHLLNGMEENDDALTLAEIIERVPRISKLKFQFKNLLDDRMATLDYNTRTVLGAAYPAILDYAVAHAFLVGDRREINGLANYIFTGSFGAKNVANYAIVSAARSFIHEKQLRVTGYNDTNSDFMKKLTAAGLQTSAAAYKSKLQAFIDDFVFNTDEAELIAYAEQHGLGPIPSDLKPLLIKYIQNSPVPITQENVVVFLPVFMSQARSFSTISDTTEIDRVESAQDFDVVFLEDDVTMVEISQAAVRCAAQLFYSMVLGDELDVFGVMNYFTHKYLLRGAIEIQDRRLREDLQNYVFSNRFTDLRTNKVVDRTRPAERQMFYRQVFSAGGAQLTEDIIVNREFPRLWKVLMLETAEYLERAQSSFYPERYVSPQNIMQAVEDLQYNLSTHTTGMSNVITPLIYAELDFVIRRILMHPDVLGQIVPQGGTWWRVVEMLHMEMKGYRPKATVLYNRAKLGHEIIRKIAEYNPATFSDDKTMSEFISLVDAFITTQSIIQEALTDYLKKEEAEEEEFEPGMNGYHPAPAMPNLPAEPEAAVEADEWDF